MHQNFNFNYMKLFFRDDDHTCNKLLEEKFKKRKKGDMPQVAAKAKDWKSALESVIKIYLNKKQLNIIFNLLKLSLNNI